MFDETGSMGAVGPGLRGVSFGQSGLLAVVAPGPSAGSLENPWEGSPVKILFAKG
jgi:hypothetical protein